VNGDWRGGRLGSYQGGFRVPFLVRWQGKAPAGATSGETALWTCWRPSPRVPAPLRAELTPQLFDLTLDPREPADIPAIEEPT